MDDDVSDNVVIARFDQFLLSGDFSADQPAARCHERRHKVLDVGLGIRIKVGVVKEERLERYLVSKKKYSNPSIFLADFVAEADGMDRQRFRT